MGTSRLFPWRGQDSWERWASASAGRNEEAEGNALTAIAVGNGRASSKRS